MFYRKKEQPLTGPGEPHVWESLPLWPLGDGEDGEWTISLSTCPPGGGCPPTPAAGSRTSAPQQGNPVTVFVFQTPGYKPRPPSRQLNALLFTFSPSLWRSSLPPRSWECELYPSHTSAPLSPSLLGKHRCQGHSDLCGQRKGQLWGLPLWTRPLTARPPPKPFLASLPPRHSSCFRSPLLTAPASKRPDSRCPTLGALLTLGLPASPWEDASPGLSSLTRPAAPRPDPATGPSAHKSCRPRSFLGETQASTRAGATWAVLEGSLPSLLTSSQPPNPSSTKKPLPSLSALFRTFAEAS